MHHEIPRGLTTASLAGAVRDCS